MSPPNKFIWLFRVREEPGNICFEHSTRDPTIAKVVCVAKWGVTPISAVRRELTFNEYRALLMTNRAETEEVYAALQDFFYRCDPRA